MKKKILLLIILSIFIVGMVMGAASASHTFKDKGYKYKMSDSKYNKMKKNAKKEAKKRSKMLGHITIPTMNIDNTINIKIFFLFMSFTPG